MTGNDALTILKTGANVFLTGEPGSGKTHTINEYVRYLRSCGIEPAITASTGIAATHVGGVTIHSWSGVGIKQYLSPQELDRLSTTEYLVKRVERAKVLIIDEISMLPAHMVSLVDAVCRAIRRREEPFGGLQVVFVGDFFQLPPVSRDGQKAVFAFMSPSWAEAAPVTCYLTEQYRQDDATFLNLLGAIRGNTFDAGHAQHMDARRIFPDDMPEDIPKLFPHNADVDRLNDHALGKIGGDTHIFSMRSTGREGLIAGLKKGCLSPENLALKIGAVVMFTKNNPSAGFVNGTLGAVVDFDADTEQPIVETREGERITVVPMEWAIEEDGKVRATITQLPLRLAWAMTVHKSQGMSLDAAVINLEGAFEYGQGYVALSRVRRLSGLYLLGYNAQSLRVHPDISREDIRFRTESEAAGAAFAALPPDELARMHEQFITACGGKLKKGVKAKKVKAKGEKSESEPGSWLARVREKYPNAYRPWSEGDDGRLRERFADGMSVKEIAAEFGRQKGSIYSRLAKLGLVDEDGISVLNTGE